MANRDEVFAAYVQCALWSSNDESTPDGGVPMDRNYGPEDLTPECVAKMRRDVESFLSKIEEQGLDVSPCFVMRNPPITVEDRLGHDFWLTRNGHGAGLWDRDLGELGDKLTTLAESFGESNLYVTDDGKIDCMEG